MALPTATPATIHDPQVVGAAFVSQYYRVLHRSPEMVYKFYQESSILSRPDPNGEMSQVTTLDGISEKIVSFKFDSYIAEIETVDSLASYNEGVLIVVTGCLTSSDSIQRKFSQSFFLAPQDKGYFVLTDIFRFVDPSQPEKSNKILENCDCAEAAEDPLNDVPEPSLVLENHDEEIVTPPLEKDPVNNDDVPNPSESCETGVEDEVDAVSPPHQSRSNNQPNHAVTPSVALDNGPKKRYAATSVVQDNGIKKSYASIVKVMGNTPPKKASVPATKSKAEAEKPLNSPPIPTVASETKVPASNNSPDNSSVDVEGYSIYVRNLPSDITTAQVEEEFKKFGPIRPGGVQVRNHKIDNFCFGFVEFASLDSMQAAIEASPIRIGRYPSYIEEKRTSTRVVDGVVIRGSNWRGRYPAGRGGFRNDHFRGNDYFRGDEGFRGRGGGSILGSNQGYARTEFRNHEEYSNRGQGRVPPGNARDAYQQRPTQNSNGRAARPVAATA